jgi:hypothetical protein
LRYLTHEAGPLRWLCTGAAQELRTRRSARLTTLALLRNRRRHLPRRGTSVTRSTAAGPYLPTHTSRSSAPASTSISSRARPCELACCACTAMPPLCGSLRHFHHPCVRDAKRLSVTTRLTTDVIASTTMQALKTPVCATNVSKGMTSGLFGVVSPRSGQPIRETDVVTACLGVVTAYVILPQACREIRPIRLCAAGPAGQGIVIHSREDSVVAC